MGLKDLTSGQAYLVVNTHFAFSVSCSKGRLSEADELAAFLNTKAGTLPVVLMGDFNTDAQSDSTRDEKTIENLESKARLFRTARFDGTTDADTASSTITAAATMWSTTRPDDRDHEGFAVG